jgi:3-oxoacyl-[acyl-carrier protein] reductase
MDLGIKNKLALVTGAGKGIGRVIALELAKEGARVAVVSLKQSDLENLMDEMGGEQKGHYAIVADLTREGSLNHLFEKLKNNFGAPEIVVNNLGGSLGIQDPFCPIEDWRNIFRFNLEVAIEINNLVIPPMKERGWGRIVNISSVASKENQGPATYCAVKAALNAYTRSVGRILAPDGIVMSAVLPGAILTQGGYWEEISKKDPERFKKYVNERMAIGRLGTSEEISSFVAFLCSEQASFCVGSIFPIDGGQGKFF